MIKDKIHQYFSGKNKVKKIVIATFIAFFIIGLIPKLMRLISTSHLAKTHEYIALTETPTIQNGMPNLELSGELKPYLHTEIFSRVNGLVHSRLVELGDKVQKGEVLATIDTPDLDEEATSAMAELVAAKKHLLESQYQYNYEKQSYKRYKNSSSDGAISRQELDTHYNSFKTSEMNYFASRAAVDKASAEAKRIQALQGYKQVRAPFSGIITKFNVDSGANVVAGGSNTSTSLFEIQQMDKFRVTLNIPQNYVQYVKVGDTLNLYTPDNPKLKIKGTVSESAQSLSPATRTMEVVAIIKNDKKSSLYSGLYVKSDINIKGKEKIMTVNPSCIVNLDTGSFVVTVDKSGIIKFVQVKIGRDFGDKVEILEGLNGNENLITNVTDELKNGQKVKFQSNK